MVFAFHADADSHRNSALPPGTGGSYSRTEMESGSETVSEVPLSLETPVSRQPVVPYNAGDGPTNRESEVSTDVEHDEVYDVDTPTAGYYDEYYSDIHRLYSIQTVPHFVYAESHVEVPCFMVDHPVRRYRENRLEGTSNFAICTTCIHCMEQCRCWYVLMQEIRSFYFDYLYPDPTTLYMESVAYAQLTQPEEGIALPEECADRVFEFVETKFNYDFYMSYGLYLDVVLRQIRARDYTMRVTLRNESPARRRWNLRFMRDFANALLQGKRYDEQMFEEMTTSVTELISKVNQVKSIPIPEEFYFQMEGACILATALFSATNVASAVCAIFSFARSVTNESIASQVKKLLLDNSWSEQADDAIDWLSLLRVARTNWKMVISNQHFTNLQNVLSIMVGLGMCKSSQVEFSIAGVRLFSQHVRKKQACALDLIDAILTTVVAFVEGGIECFRSGSLRPMLYGDLEMNDLEQQAVRCERLFQFAKTGDLNKAEPDMTDNLFIQLQERTIERLQEMKRTQRSPIAEKMISTKLDKLRREKTEFDRIRTKGGLRMAPWSSLIYGGSGVGKSSVSNILMVVSLLQNGFPASDEYLCTNNEYDKYDSTLRSYVTGIFFDDMCNTKTELVDGAPCSRLIEVVNNVRAYGNMAEIELKGKVTKEPKVVVTTTNVKNLNSVEQSNEPLSIERRNAFIMTVRVRDQFATHKMLDGAKVRKFYANWTETWADGTTHTGIPLVPDLWLLSVEKAIGVDNPLKGRPQLVTYEPVQFEGRPMIDVDILTVLRWNKVASAEHFANQKQLVANQTNLAGKLGMCSDCGLPGMCCCCLKQAEEQLAVVEDQLEGDVTVNSKGRLTPVDIIDDMISDVSVVGSDVFFDSDQSFDEQFGGIIGRCAINMFEARRKRAQSWWHRWEGDIEARLFQTMEKRLAKLEEHPYFQWTNWLPESWIKDEQVMQAILWTRSDEIASVIRRKYVNGILFSVVGLLCIFFLAWRYKILGYMIFTYNLIKIAKVVETEKARLYAKIREDNAGMSATFKKHRDSIITYATNGCLALGAAYALACIIRHIKMTCYTEQGNLAPTSMEDIQERDREAEIVQTIAEEQNWDTVRIAPIPCSEKSRTATTDQLSRKTWTNETAFEWRDGDDFKPACGMFFIESNVAIIPQHMWKKCKNDDLEIRISRGTKRIQKFHAIISLAHAVNVPNTDLSIVYVPNAGSWADLREYLPHTHYAESRSVPLRFIYKQMYERVDPGYLTCDTVGKFGNVGTNTGRRYFGAEYTLAFPTNPGLCMGVLISRTRESMIVGFHTAGINGSYSGAMCSLVRSDYEHARVLLSKQPGVCISASEGKLQEQIYGQTVLTSRSIHPKSPVHTLPQDAHIDVYGSCTGRATYYSDVIETPIADSVCEACGVEKLFDKPQFHKGDAWKKSLAFSCRPSIGVEPSLLVQAVNDYVYHMIERVESLPQLKEFIRPLSRMENVCGIDGLRFIDKLNPHTAIGYPLTGSKESYIELLNPEDYPGVACPAKLDEMFWIEAERMETEYLEDRRCHVPFKACLKDEPTKKTINKVRVFQAAPVAFQLLIRKYFLPLVRLLSLFPLDSECGVGINTMGPEFDELVRFMHKHGADRILAGDYNKYDLRMPAQVILAAFDVLIIIAKHFGYSEQALRVMRGIATDIAYPLMAYNGDLIQHYGSNPSGQNLTVYINSLVNSLLLRCAYFKIYENKCVPAFRDAVAMMTYGDDAKGSVKKGFDEFNHVSYAEFLRDHDMVFTMPDKESTPVPYMRDEDADFLKRKNVFCPELQQWMGALDEQSIFKSLTAVCKSKAITPLEQSMQNIDGGLREWFYHGRKKYEERRAQMQTVAAKHGITGGCSMLNKSYDECLEMYKIRYGLESH